MAVNTMALIGVWRWLQSRVAGIRSSLILTKSSNSHRGTRTTFESVVLATLVFALAAIAKYPNRAIFTRARPDLKGKTAPGFPVLGNMPQLVWNRERALHALNNTFKIFGDNWMLSMPIYGTIILCNSPAQMEHIFRRPDTYIKGFIFQDQLSDILGEGIFVSDGERWKLHRKTASNIFTTKLYRQLVQGAFKETGLDLCRALNDQCAVYNQPQLKNTQDVHAADLQALFLKLTLDAFGKLTFGLNFESLKLGEGRPHEFGDSFDYLTSVADERVANPAWYWTDFLIPGKKKKQRQAIGVLDKYAAMAVKARREESEDEKEKRPRDLLDHFINHTSESGSKLTDVELRDVFVNFMIAGRDTTAQALSWQFLALMKSPRVMNNLRKEIRIVLGESSVDTDGYDTLPGISYEILNQELPYLRAVFHETLRLWPPVPKNVKIATEPDVLPGGIRVYKGDIVASSTWCLGRNKSVWGEDAEEFVPERWLVIPEDGDELNGFASAARTAAGVHRKSPFGKFRAESQFKFTSFNAGPRLCLGQTFATLEAMMTTCLLLRNFDFQLKPGQPPVEPKNSVTLPMQNPLLTIVTRRGQ
ncbi:hypothetical protein BGW38_004820 [Lunasporangiospora selenospora]|uniref:Cytochrome P450 n=1 Tax=Lunasporangiospora selenospora TaxID=979761 RepID=A0A9P6G0A8_9FUNG|nr:hypothetical protein BGW38_004820 [Lunasporangiospora selenospora]